MRRRSIWAITLLLLFIIGTGSIMLTAGLMKALSFGMYFGSDLEHDLAVLVTWPAFGLALVAHGIGAWRRRKRKFAYRAAAGEVGQIALAIFFGGLLSLARASGIGWDRPLVAALFLGYVVLDARAPQSSHARRLVRAFAMLSVGVGTTWIIHHAAH